MMTKYGSLSQVHVHVHACIHIVDASILKANQTSVDKTSQIKPERTKLTLGIPCLTMSYMCTCTVYIHTVMYMYTWS